VLVGWARQIGLEPSSDGIANLFLRLRGREPALPPVLVGSHIDTVPTGGKFDGAFGVVAALESAQAILAAGLCPRRTIEVVSWTNEEGTRFAPSLMGSSVFAGKRRLQDVATARDEFEQTVTEALARVFESEPDVPRRELGFPAAAYLEAHIEQGPLLESAKKSIGVVTGIHGKRNFRVTVKGVPNHAATTPGKMRRDALVQSVRILDALNNAVWGNDEEVRFTVGKLNVLPNQPYVIPGEVKFHVDIRHPNRMKLNATADLIHQICRTKSGQCEVTVH